MQQLNYHTSIWGIRATFILNLKQQSKMLFYSMQRYEICFNYCIQAQLSVLFQFILIKSNSILAGTNRLYKIEHYKRQEAAIPIPGRQRSTRRECRNKLSFE